MAANIKVTQIRSVARANPRTRRTLRALGLGKIGTKRTFPSNAAVLGMLKSVGHWVSVEQD